MKLIAIDQRCLAPLLMSTIENSLHFADRLEFRLQAASLAECHAQLQTG